MIAAFRGGSSGGITAFNTAWQRPEAFSRVYCASGSFVAFRGGHEFPTLVRKFEAKRPIRTFMTTGTRTWKTRRATGSSSTRRWTRR
jgi:gluconolactonase